MTNKIIEYCYTMDIIDGKSNYSLYRLMTIRLEDKPVASFWKRAYIFGSKQEFELYCSMNGISNISENPYVIDGKVEYLN